MDHGVKNPVGGDTGRWERSRLAALAGREAVWGRCLFQTLLLAHGPTGNPSGER